jgi:hypothetical protein
VGIGKVKKGGTRFTNIQEQGMSENFDARKSTPSRGVERRIKQPLKWLVAINLMLVVALVFGSNRRNKIQPNPVSSAAGQPGSRNLESANAPGASGANSGKIRPAKSDSTAPETPFAQVYSPDVKQFAANLRAIRCPEQTMADVLKAETHRRFSSQEEALRPTPADHVPWGWSAQTTEPRLLERRQEAAALAREEGGVLREALGCEATVPMPLYAMTSSDLQFEERLSASPSMDGCAIRQIHDDYWAQVQALQQRTKGFWLPEDVAELNRLKAQHKQTLAAYLPDQ